MAKKTPRPGRTLIVFGLSILLLYGLAALGQTWRPSLGLDLEGGTRITLSAIPEGGAITATKLKQAASIVDKRVNGSGVAEAEVTTQGDRNIIVEIPGKNASNLVETVKRTAQLRFRLVVGQPQPGTPAAEKKNAPPANPSASPSPSPSDKGKKKPDETKPDKKSQPGQGEVAKPTATPKPRPAPFADPTPQAPQAPGAPTGQPAQPDPNQPDPNQVDPNQQQQPQVTQKGAPINDPLKWAQDPGVEWLKKYEQFQCPSGDKAVKPSDDIATQPLITCNDEGLKFLLSRGVIEGTELKSASYGVPDGGVGFAVNLGLKDKGPETLSTISTALQPTGGTFAIVLDGQVISYAGFNEPILDGNAQITGSFTETEARSLSNSLKFGALPIKFAKPTVETIGPSLAGNQLSAGIWAGAVGLLIVMLYCLVYYRGLGIVVVSSLLVAGVITYGAVLVLAKAAGFTLTLPGIAGLIVGVGITADSFIVYFERIRDEMRDGRSMRVAVEVGWLSARKTCLAADAVSLLAAVVLYIFAIGVVRGFAFALGLSTLIDVVIFFFFTKPMVSLLAKRRFFSSGHRFSGLSAETLGVDEIPAHARMAGGNA